MMNENGELCLIIIYWEQLYFLYHLRHINQIKKNSRISNIRLEFDAKDISYIIVERTDEIPDIIKIVRDCFGKRCTSEQLDILFSKICSTEQIIADY